MIVYLDENDFIKKEKGLRRYFRRAYTYLCFDIKDRLKQGKHESGSFERSLPVDELFNKVYGELKVRYTVSKGTVIFEDITPGDILIQGYMKNLPIYKGIPYRDKKDLMKIKLVEGGLSINGWFR